MLREALGEIETLQVMVGNTAVGNATLIRARALISRIEGET